MGTNIFLTKKQKAQMRERRKKKLKALGAKSENNQIPGNESSESQNQENGSSPTQAIVPTSDRPNLKRPRDDEVTTSPTAVDKKSSSNNNKNTLDLHTQLIDGKLYVMIPMELSAKEVKKFRKDARRQLRRQPPQTKSRDVVGNPNDPIEEDNIVFCPQDELPPEFRRRKRQKQFPSIKELLQQKQQQETAQKEEEKKQQKLSQIPEDIKSQYVALDCEMVGIGTDGKKSALARVSIVDWDLNIVLDTYVKVPIRVTDFRTHVSGVEPKHLKDKKAMEVEQCREAVAQILKGKILVGHALTNDFKALMLNHPKAKIRDTAKYRPFQRYGNKKWRARKLRDLVKENLKGKEQFQEAEHDSVQDARATMELFQLVRTQWEKELASKTK